MQKLRPFPLSVNDVRELLTYDPDGGSFTWRTRDRRWFTSNNAHATWNARFANREAGTISSSGYRVIVFDKQPWPAHRIAWLLMTGDWPDMMVDHANTVRTDNRWVNLRLATPSQNSFNLAPTDRALPRGVILSHNKTNPYRAKIRFMRKTIYLGYFATAKEAGDAFKKAALALYGEFAPL